MDIREKIIISSSWSVSGDSRKVLHIGNSSTGTHLNEPLESEQPSNTLLTLDRFEADTDLPCFLTIDMCRLQGYLPSSVELVSESRTVEMYDGQENEYLATAKGTTINTNDNDMRLYSCVFELPTDSFLSNISLKLLSLKGKEQVHISKLFLDLTKDHKESKEALIPKPPTNTMQHQQFLSTLASQNLPPFLRGLVSSLQSVSSRKDPMSTPDLMGMASALRQVHNSLATTSKEPEINSEQAQKVQQGKVVAIQNEEGSQTVDNQLLSKLEERLKIYIDTKFAEIEQKIEDRLERILEASNRCLSVPNINGDDDIQTNGCGLVEDSDQLD